MNLARVTAKIQTSAWGFSPTIHVKPDAHTSKGIRLAHSTALFLAAVLEETIAEARPNVGWVVYVERGGNVASVRIELTNETEAEAAEALLVLQRLIKVMQSSNALATKTFQKMRADGAVQS